MKIAIYAHRWSLQTLQIKKKAKYKKPSFTTVFVFLILILYAQAYGTQVDTVFLLKFGCVSICESMYAFLSFSPPCVLVNVSMRWLDFDLDTCETVRNGLHM